ncbi:hypothetical protein EV360DRAFT_75323 [Lentinula raphanica]|nr:hypothetical protein EV360DRAFT_75323 [Lentinula raphanica]
MVDNFLLQPKLLHTPHLAEYTSLTDSTPPSAKQPGVSIDPSALHPIKMIDRPLREKVFFLDDHDYHQSFSKPVNVRRRPASMIANIHTNGNMSFPVSSPTRRLSVHRPLRSSPLAGPALSSEGLVIPDEDVQRRCKPSRISSSPEIPSVPSSSSLYPADSLLSPSQPGIPPRPSLAQRNSSPNYQTIPAISLLKSPSAPSLHIPSTSPSGTPSRSPSRESVSSTSSPPIPNAPRSAPAVPGDWLISNTYGEIPRFSRVNMGSKVIMPVSAKEYRRKSISSVRSISNLSTGGPSPPTSPSGSSTCGRSGLASGVRSEELDNACPSEPIRNVHSRKSISSLASKVRRRASTLLSVGSDSSLESRSIESAPSMLQSTSLTSLSSGADSSDIDFLLSPSLPPRAPSSAHSRGSSNSDCAIIDEEAEAEADDDDGSATPESATVPLPIPIPYTQSLPEKKEVKRKTFLFKFRRLIGAHRLTRPRVSDVS